MAEEDFNKMRPLCGPFRKEVRKRLAELCLWRIALKSYQVSRAIRGLED